MCACGGWGGFSTCERKASSSEEAKYVIECLTSLFFSNLKVWRFTCFFLYIFSPKSSRLRTNEIVLFGSLVLVVLGNFDH